MKDNLKQLELQRLLEIDEITVQEFHKRTKTTGEKIHSFLNKSNERLFLPNVYTHEKDLDTSEGLKIGKTVYPEGKKQMSLNGVEEFYGLQEH